MINGSYDKDSDATKLYNALSTLSDHVTTMDTALMSFYLSISKIIETAKDNFIAARLGKPHSADIQIESLIQIIQKSQILFRKIQGEISQNESVSVDLVLKLFRDHNEEAIYLANTFSRLLEELYDFMSTAYTAYNGSANLMKNILSDLKVVEALQRFDEETLREINPSMQKLSEVAKIYKNENMAIYTKLTHSKDRVKEEQRRLEDDMPNFDMLKELGFPNGLSICNEDDCLTNIENYIESVNRLLACPLSEENNAQAVSLATFMVPETEELRETFKNLRVNALENKDVLAKVLVRYKPQSLIKN
ncbi:hypothetical protein HPULCUR_000618 [Helicostylum pulchrum]|uniref:Uncharacterized protein n=1 Tax=Helicostylum pulchrum TaxID=562976 RepID=A0ABP9XMB4_9FUNG